jgi:3-isopropylmalate/(R)-2-methylmalate dehydratase small subunit
MPAQIASVTGTGIPLLLDDIDTDRIIPARYLRCVTFEGLGEHAFEDDRKQDPSHPFDNPKFQGASVLVAGRNFGCGSSREHAPQALIRWGIKAIVGESFAEIFFGNCTSNGVPLVTASAADLKQLAAAIEANPKAEVTVDLLQQQVRVGAVSVPCQMQAGAKQALVSGNWDFLGQLVDAAAEVKQTSGNIPYLNGYKV